MTDFRNLSRRRFLQFAGTAGATGLLALPTGVVSYPLPTDGAGFVGYAIDQLTLRPVAGALVQADPLGIQTTTDPKGAYVLRLPSGSYTIRVIKDQYIGAIRPNLTVDSGFANLDLDLVPAYPSPDQQMLLYQHMVKQTENSLLTPDDSLTDGFRVADSSIPTQITVLYNGSYQTMSVEDYVKGVVPSEMPPSWPAAALQAQAVAARSYGIAEFKANGYVCSTTSCQVYNPQNSYYPTTIAAVDATAGQVLTVNGSVIPAFFFAQCNGSSTRNSENAIGLQSAGNGQYTCTNAPWNYVSYCRARVCNLHGPSANSNCGYWGHGVGMCQYGSLGHGSAGSSYQDILNSYYTGVTISGASAPPTATPTFAPTPTPTPIPVPRLFGPFIVQVDRQPITLTWSNLGSGFTYTVTVTPPGNSFPLGPYFVGSNYLTLPQTLALGWYTWTVQTSADSSASGTLEVVPKVYNTNLPLVGNG